jgi:hypothetical protein
MKPMFLFLIALGVLLHFPGLVLAQSLGQNSQSVSIDNFFSVDNLSIRKMVPFPFSDGVGVYTALTLAECEAAVEKNGQQAERNALAAYNELFELLNLCCIPGTLVIRTNGMPQLEDGECVSFSDTSLASSLFGLTESVATISTTFSCTISETYLSFFKYRLLLWRFWG